MYEVKCSECRKTVRETSSFRESAAGATCEDCKAEHNRKLTLADATMRVVERMRRKRIASKARA